MLWEIWRPWFSSNCKGGSVVAWVSPGRGHCGILAVALLTCSAFISGKYRATDEEKINPPPYLTCESFPHAVDHILQHLLWTIVRTGSNLKRTFSLSGMNPSPAQWQHRQTHPSAQTGRWGAALSYCALIRKKGIELQPATRPCLSLLFYFVKENETHRKGKLRFYAILFKIFIRFAGLGGRT